MGDETKYNGWTNYNTWAIALWLNNDQNTQSYFIEEATRIKENPEFFKIGEKEFLRKPIFRLEDFIKKEIENSNPLEENGQHGLYSDVLTHGLAHVNYKEIAESFMEGL